MKLTKKLIPALGMLVLSASMLVTSTFAWFSMNTTVKATDMTVSAKGDQVYLQIINEAGTFANGAAQTSAEAKTKTSPKLLPTNVYKTCPTANDPAESEKYDGKDAYVWVTNYLTTNADGSTSKTSYATVSDDDLTKSYALENKFQIRLDPTAGAAASKTPLKVSGVSVEITNDGSDPDKNFAKCLSVFVVSTYTDGSTTSTAVGSVWENINGNGSLEKTLGNDTISGSVLKNSEVVDVTIYVFFNGDSTHCTQANLAKMAEANYKVTVTFSL